MLSYCSKKEFVDILFSDEEIEAKTNVIQTGSTSCLTEKNKPLFLNNLYLKPVLDLEHNDFKLLQLSEYKINTKLKTHLYIKNSVDKVGRILKQQLNTIKSHTSFLAIIDPLSQHTTNIISSTTFYDYPFCTFFSKCGLFFIPPNTVFFEPNDYAIFDNIYHEALHQELLIQILLDKIFNNYKLVPKENIIPIPWRNTLWTIEHALQAYYVYRHLCISRQLFSQSLKDNIMLEKMKMAILASKYNSEYLYTQLMNHKHLFMKDCLNLLKALMFENDEHSDFLSLIDY